MGEFRWFGEEYRGEVLIE